ncbi:unnamed protein product, partial [Polarella glacialis]
AKDEKAVGRCSRPTYSWNSCHFSSCPAAGVVGFSSPTICPPGAGWARHAGRAALQHFAHNTNTPDLLAKDEYCGAVKSPDLPLEFLSFLPLPNDWWWRWFFKPDDLPSRGMF